MIFLGIVLKIPLAFACWLLWWAWRAAPDPAEAPEEGGGDRSHRFRREPKRPRGPRRGPHGPGGALPLPCPREPALRVIRRRPPVPAPALATQRTVERR